MSTRPDTLWQTGGVNSIESSLASLIVTVVRGDAVPPGTAAEPALAHAQHLLRNLHNGPALSENPFVAGLGIGPVRDVLEHLCAALGEEAAGGARDSSVVRQYEIFRRCDLAGEPHSSVAAALGISRRQFYRERRQIAHRVAEAFSGARLASALHRGLSETEILRMLRAATAPDQRLLLETLYSDLLHESQRDHHSKRIDTIVCARLCSMDATFGVPFSVLQYASIRLARRYLRRGDPCGALNALERMVPNQCQELKPA